MKYFLHLYIIQHSLIKCKYSFKKVLTFDLYLCKLRLLKEKNMSQLFKSKLNQTVMQYPTDYWNNSCSVEELTYAVGQGAVGATTNPNIVVNVLKKEMHLWKDRIDQLILSNPTWSESDITWKLVEEMATHGASFLNLLLTNIRVKKAAFRSRPIRPSIAMRRRSQSKPFISAS